MIAMEIESLVEFDRHRFVSKLLHDAERARVALFCLESGQEVPVHTTSSEVIFHVVEGQGRVIVGNEKTEVKAGSLVICPSQAPHGLEAKERLVVVAVIAPRP